MCDNITAVNVINHMGTSHPVSCNSLAKEIWEWCIARDIWLSVWLRFADIPGKQNSLLILNLEGIKGKQNGGLTTPHSRRRSNSIPRCTLFHVILSLRS